MYEINDEGLRKLNTFINKKIAAEIGVHVGTISLIKRKRKLCNKQTAYCLTKFFDSNAEIADYFTRKEK